MRVTNTFLPLLKESNHPRFVNVSSGLGSFGQVLNPEKIESKINAVNPGPTKTGEKFSNGQHTVTEGTDAVVRMATIDQMAVLIHLSYFYEFNGV